MWLFCSCCRLCLTEDQAGLKLSSNPPASASERADKGKAVELASHLWLALCHVSRLGLLSICLQGLESRKQLAFSSPTDTPPGDGSSIEQINIKGHPNAGGRSTLLSTHCPRSSGRRIVNFRTTCNLVRPPLKVKMGRAFGEAALQSELIQLCRVELLVPAGSSKPPNSVFRGSDAASGFPGHCTHAVHSQTCRQLYI